MKIDKIYIISLNAGDPSVQRNIAAKVDHLGMPYSVGWEIVQGFDGTSVREIASKAEVNLSAINYHFENTQTLLIFILIFSF